MDKFCATKGKKCFHRSNHTSTGDRSMIAHIKQQWTYNLVFFSAALYGGSPMD